MSRRLHSWFRRCEERPWSANAPTQPLGPGTPVGPARYTAPAPVLPPLRYPAPPTTEEEEEAHRQEDEYQMALALSLSAREGRLQSLSDQEEEELVRAKRDSLVPSTSSGAAQALSWSLFTANCLNYDDIVCDGLYDVWGEFPEVQPGGIAKVFPSLDELCVIPFTPGDAREVVVVDHEHDSGLCTVDEVAAEAVNNAIKKGAKACVQALAKVVVDSMGGPCSATEIAQVCWEHAQELKHRRGSLVIPIGELQVGLARHRALLFKTLADACRLPCRVVRGQYYLGNGASGDSAIVTVRLDGVEYLVDLFSEGGQIRPVAQEATRQLQPKSSHPHQDGDLGRGLDWHGELDGPALLNLENSHSDATTTQDSTEVQPASRHRYSPSIEDALDVADAQLRALRTTSDRFAVVSHEQTPQHAADSAPPPGYPGNQAQQAPRQMSGSREIPPSTRRSPVLDTQQAASPSYPSIVYSPSPVFHSSSPFAPLPYLGQSPDRKELPSTSSIFERMLRGKAAAGQAIAGVPSLPTVQEALPSPFSTADAQQDRPEHDSRGSLGGQFELLETMYPYEPNREPPPERAMYYPPPSGDEFLSAPSPFADPEVQQDLGHVLSPGATRALNWDDEETEARPEAAAREEGDAGGGGCPPPAEEASGLAVRSDGVRDGSFQAAVRPSMRRHSDSDVFLEANRRFDGGREAEPDLRQALPSTAELATTPATSLEQAGDGVSIPSAGRGDSLNAVDEWEIDASEIRLGPRIGIGSFGEVYRATWRHTDVAVKRLIDQELSPQLMEEFRAEVAIMKRLRHQNVVLFMGACTSTPNLSIITQFVPRGSLFRLLHRTPNLVLDERRKLRMAIDVARGMHYLHSCRIVHRDLKSPNLLVDKDFTVKVCDFGLSRVRRSTLLSGKSQAGTPEWTAPEVLRSQAYDETSDCYSFGVIVWELLTEEEPWQDKTAMQVVGAVGWGNARLQFPDGTDPKIASLILSCWGEPRGRPSFSDIIEYLQGCKESIFHLPPRPESPHVEEQPVFLSNVQHIDSCTS